MENELQHSFRNMYGKLFTLYVLCQRILRTKFGQVPCLIDVFYEARNSTYWIVCRNRGLCCGKRL